MALISDAVSRVPSSLPAVVGSLAHNAVDGLCAGRTFVPYRPS